MFELVEQILRRNYESMTIVLTFLITTEGKDYTNKKI